MQLFLSVMLLFFLLFFTTRPFNLIFGETGCREENIASRVQVPVSVSYGMSTDAFPYHFLTSQEKTLG